MRWRVDHVDPETRRVAKAAANAAGLPLGSWLDRAIRSRVGPSQPAPREEPRGAGPEGDADPAPARPSDLADEGSSRHGEAEDRTPEVRSNPDLASVDPPPTAQDSPRPSPNRRALALIGGAGLAVALIAGALWLWPPFAPRDGRDASTAPSAKGPSQPAVTERAPEATSRRPSAPATPQTEEQFMEALRRDAANGDAMAQHDLALAYVNGRGVPQNYAIAADWFEKSAQAGSERAQFNLAVLYENALGVPQDFERTFELYHAAAEQGFGPAQHNVAVAYAQGRGVSRDYQAAALWFRRAADQGIASAQFNLGMIYERGLAGAPDEQTAHGWYRRAAAAGSEAALARLTALEGRIASPPSQQAGPGAGKPVKPTAADVAEMQRLLNRLSFNPGPADGKAGKATREAIRHYQEVAGLPVTGEPSGALLTHLRQVVAMMESGTR